MKWSCRAPTEPQPWEKWFAWYPLQVGRTNEWVWMEWVERRRHYPFEHSRFGAFWVYRSGNRC